MPNREPRPWRGGVLASHQHQRIVGVHVCLAVTTTVEHDRVIEHRSTGLRGFRQLCDELRRMIRLKLVVLPKFDQVRTSLSVLNPVLANKPVPLRKNSEG